MNRYSEEKRFWNNNYSPNINGDNPFLLFLNELLVDDYKCALAKLPLSSRSSILEIGPGTKGVSQHIYKSVYFVDFSLPILQKIKANDTHNRYVCASCDALPFREGAFDLVICNDVLHHLKAEGQLQQGISKIYSAIRQNGLFCVVDRNPHSIILPVLLGGTMILKKLIFKFCTMQSHGSMNEPLFTTKDYRIVNEYFTDYAGPLFRYNICLFGLSICCTMLQLFTSPCNAHKLLARVKKNKHHFKLRQRSLFQIEMFSIFKKRGENYAAG